MTVLQKPHTHVWGTLRRYLTYTTAGIAIMGGIGAFEAHRPKSVLPASASDLVATFSGTQAVSQGFANSGALGSDETLPVWAQRIPTTSENNFTVAAAEKGSEPTPFVAAPALTTLMPGSALESAPDSDIDTETETAAVDPVPSAAPVEPVSMTPLDAVAAEFGMGAGRRDWNADDSVIREAKRDIQKVISVQRGDTLYGVLVEAGLSETEAKNTVGALSDVFSPRALKAGQEITLNLTTAAGGDTVSAAPQPQLVSLSLEPSVERDVTVSRDSTGELVAEAVDKPLTETRARAAGIITFSLYDAAMKAGLPSSVIADVIKAYSYDVDFQRDIQEGDSFEVVYERLENDEGELARTGQMLYAALTTSGVTRQIYWFEHDGDGEFYNSKGEAVRKTLLATPIDGARITSGFGARKHPILGYTKVHKGVDFGAPTGTPIYAAGNGVIVEMGPKGSYGNYVRIKHNGTYQTAYAHTSRFAKGLHKGDKVKQGQVIAYVGTTGRSTGPHLHFEVLVDGAQVNPKNIKSTGSTKLAGKDLKSFKAQVAAIDADRERMRGAVEIAERPDAETLDCSDPQGCQN
ncbi:M23 family metallopeptidase [Dongia rigui]|uniref:Peptidoglycan DD-metalloendopeptidase family protein n=1 Tax=Dongia rigui TaxID=940149 RepID=A0ABU5E6C8_9PROT|nr:peptidoglycan DD-metalloendopeptidase family protein [Dongia rigui]MDY0874518.1 peptidoglycan DD-metalloendopeptidase family protein [Dongia rigui]